MNFCAGVKYITYHTRFQYWIRSIWTVINRVIDLCPDCERRKAERQNLALSQSGLQPYRFQLQHRTFIHAFIDILGPITTKDYIWLNTVGDAQTASNNPLKKNNKRAKVESKKIPYEVKRFILTATCSQTRLLNLEILDGKSTPDVINGLRRFFARRNVPEFITSDVSTEFVRSSKELDLLWKNLHKKDLHEFAISKKLNGNLGFHTVPNVKGS